MKKAKRFAVTVHLVKTAGSSRRAIRRGAQLVDFIQKKAAEVAPGTEVSLSIPHRYTERLARPPSRPNDALLRMKDIVKRTALSRSTVYRLERAGKFPKRREMSENIVAWSEREVLAWMASRRRRGGDGHRV